MIACPKDSLWRRLCEAIERPDLGDDDRYQTLAARSENRRSLLPELERVLAAKPVEHWLGRLLASGVPSAPVNDVAEALADRQVRSRRAMVEYTHPVLGPVSQPASPLRLSSGRSPARRAPYLGEHTELALASVCGYAPERLRALAAAGAFGEPAPEPIAVATAEGGGG